MNTSNFEVDKKPNQHLQRQISGAVVNQINSARFMDEITQLTAQDMAFKLAVEQIDGVRTFLETPENITTCFYNYS